MRIFPKETAAERSYTELLQKKANEKAAGYKQTAVDFKTAMERQEEEFHQIIENLEGMKEQQEGIQFLKEKQEYVLKNFPTLEGNIVEKIKGSQAKNTKELLQRLEEMELAQKKRNIWTQTAVWISLVCSLASVGGVAVILLYLADLIAF